MEAVFRRKRLVLYFAIALAAAVTCQAQAAEMSGQEASGAEISTSSMLHEPGAPMPAAEAAGQGGSAVEVSTGSMLGEPGHGAEANESVPLALADAVVISLKNNLEVRVISYTPRISSTDVDRQWSQFDPLASASLSYAAQKSPFAEANTLTRQGVVRTAGTSLQRTNVESFSIGGGLAVRTLTGATASVQSTSSSTETDTALITGKNNSIRTFRSARQSDLVFQVIQPLLKNAGVGVNKARILIAQNNTRSSAYQFEDQLMQQVLNISTAYWSLVLAREDLRTREKSLQAAQDLLRNNTIKYEAGALARVEVTRAKARVADRENAIVLAKAAIGDAEDRLRGLLDSSQYALLSTAEIRPTDEPTVQAEQLDLAESVRTALSLRPDIRQQVVTIESLGILVATAKHQLLPEVDLQATYSINGLGDSWQRDFDTMNSFDGTSVSAGVTFSYTLGNRSARADLMSDRYQRLQGLASLEVLQRNATLAVKKAVRDVATALQTVDTNRVRVQSAQENLDAEIQKYEVGQSISLDVLDAQDQLQQAESGYNQAIVNFNIAMANYYRSTGEILQRFGVTVEPLSVVKKDSQTLVE